MRRWRRVRGRVPRQAEAAARRPLGDRRGHKDAEARLGRQGPQRLPHGGLDNGPVRAPQRDIPPGGRDEEQPRDDNHRVHGERQPGHFPARE